MTGYFLSLITLFSISIMLAQSLNLVKGYSGIMVVSHAASMGVGGYTAGVLAVRVGWDPTWTILIGTVAAGLVGLLFMAAASQLNYDDFILASFAFQMAMFDLFSRWTPVTGGTVGLFGIPRPTVFGYELTDLPLAIVVFVIMLGVGLTLSYVANSGFGITLRAIRESERSAQAAGKHLFRTKVVTFAFTAAIAGLAGGLYATRVGLVTPADFSVNKSILIIAFLLVGGIGNMRGAVIGTVLLLTLPEIVSWLTEFPTTLIGPVNQIIYGLVIVLFVWFRPDGLFPERPILKLRSIRDNIAGFMSDAKLHFEEAETIESTPMENV